MEHLLAKEGVAGSIPVSRSFIFYIRGYPDEISSFFIFEHIYARRFNLVVCRLDRCISVASTRRHAPSRALDESLFESAFGEPASRNS